MCVREREGRMREIVCMKEREGTGIDCFYEGERGD